MDKQCFGDTINGFGISQEPPPESDLTYLDRSRLEEEYRKLKELKKKAEYYAVEAKQTAQRLSAENFKLKEDLSRERHHNELTRKNMIREMEQKMDKSATALDRADARLEVFEQEVNERALQMIRRMSAPTALALQLPGATSKYSWLVVLYSSDVISNWNVGHSWNLECVLISELLGEVSHTV